MKLDGLRQLIKEELKRVLSENMFKVGDVVKYMGEDHKVTDDDGFIVTLTTMRGNGKKENTVNLNYKQAKEKVRKATDFTNEVIDYKPGGWTTDPEKPWKTLPPGKYKVTYKPMLPLDAVRTYVLDLPDGKEFEDYEEAKKFYYRNQPGFPSIEDRMKRLVSVTKIEESKDTQLDEIKVGQIDVGDVFTLIGDIGLFKKGEKVQVKDKGVYGNDVKLILSNDQGITDEFLLDIDDDFEELI